MRSRLFALVAAFALAFFGCGEDAPEPKTDAPDAAEDGPKERIVSMTAEQAEELNVKTTVVKLEPTEYVVAVPCLVEPAPDNQAIISAPINGRIARIYRREGEYVGRGRAVFSLESLEFANLVSDLVKAHAEEKLVKNKYDRAKELASERISSESEVEQLEADYARARASYKAARARLRSVGVGEAQIEKFIQGDYDAPVLFVSSPIAGVVSRVEVSLGEAVEAYEEMGETINLSRVRLVGYLSPEDAEYVKPGDEFVAFSKGENDKRVSGKINTLNPALDERNKSISVNAVVRTVDNWPKPGQNLRMEITSTTETPSIVVPLDALEYEGEDAYVFVKQDSVTYRKIPIVVARETGDKAIVASGLAEGDEVAVSNVFDLKAMSKYSEFAED